ncbi:alpha/beta hydrolase-fold protein [Paenibacillus sp. N3/727]|uniref:alpha/beta hydrolase n=1 Tax=Paenibacillus sp. N3/727 TaxID=2925845 RepID=UPI001F52C099|nr:alpha/beta hydrolase-fold protein [Paenibacillus sp. N3/727]UNK17557.1 alpha/beta hydrolase-fold protein [Paenibacillus sp. N3/727]
MGKSMDRLIVVTEFESSWLDNKRKLYIYLPPSYRHNKDRRYPVLYMHDGQHVFQADAAGASWEMHQTADRLALEGKIEEIIVVGIAIAPHQRLNEYFHDGPGIRQVFDPPFSGELYEQCVIQEIIPYINENFRTLTGPEHTAMMGSSAGGIVTYNIGFRNPQIFGKIAVLSPYFVHTVFEEGTLKEQPFYQRYDSHPNLKVWMDMGDAEGLFMPKYASEEAVALIRDGFVPDDDLMLLIHHGAGHSQKDWAARVHAPLLYFFGTLGQTETAVIYGDEVIGIQGPDAILYPVVHYDSGFMHTPMTGEYTVKHPELLDVLPDGTLKAKAPGVTTIIFEYNGVKAHKKITIVEKVQEYVKVSIRVDVPDDTPSYRSIYAGIELLRAGEYTYEGSAQIPRGLTFTFKIARGFGQHEKNKDGSPMRSRSFTALKNLDLYYCVQAWED